VAEKEAFISIMKEEGQGSCPSTYTRDSKCLYSEARRGYFPSEIFQNPNIHMNVLIVTADVV
jgi:hypothetical protein